MNRSPHQLFTAALILTAAGGCGDDTGSAADTGTTTAGQETTGDPDTTSNADDGTTGQGTTAADDTTSGDGSSTGEPLSRLELIEEALFTAMFLCPDRAWPEVADNMRTSQIMLVSVQNGEAYLWNDQHSGAESPGLTEVDFASLGAEWHSTFEFGVYNDVRTLGISLDVTAELNAEFEKAGVPQWHDYALGLTFHEGMHYLSGQSGWNVNPGSRSLPYPEPWEPRYFRAQMGWALRGELEDGTVDFGTAAFWREAAFDAFPNDMNAIASYDITEGSAEYGSAMMSALAALGCDATDEELVDAVVEHLDSYASLSHYSGGREPYDLGVLTGLSLQRVGADGWQGVVEDGTTMQQVLLSQFDPEAAPDDADVQASAQEAVNARNEVAAERIEPMLLDMADPSFYRLPVPPNWIQGSFSPGAFYYLADEPGEPDLWLSYSALHETPSGTVLDVQELTSLLGIANPCAVGQGTIVLLIPAAEATDNGDGTFTSSNTQVAFEDLTAMVIEDENALPWLCPEQSAAPPAPSHGLSTYDAKTEIAESLRGRPILLPHH
ncbi:MAG: hypothetical protein ACRBN8_21780 [Nannocystales bacterium]